MYYELVPNPDAILFFEIFNNPVLSLTTDTIADNIYRVFQKFCKDVLLNKFYPFV